MVQMGRFTTAPKVWPTSQAISMEGDATIPVKMNRSELVGYLLVKPATKGALRAFMAAPINVKYYTIIEKRKDLKIASLKSTYIAHILHQADLTWAQDGGENAVHNDLKATVDEIEQEYDDDQIMFCFNVLFNWLKEWEKWDPHTRKEADEITENDAAENDAAEEEHIYSDFKTTFRYEIPVQYRHAMKELPQGIVRAPGEGHKFDGFVRLWNTYWYLKETSSKSKRDLFWSTTRKTRKKDLRRRSGRKMDEDEADREEADGEDDRKELSNVVYPPWSAQSPGEEPVDEYFALTEHPHVLAENMAGLLAPPPTIYRELSECTFEVRKNDEIRAIVKQTRETASIDHGITYVGQLSSPAAYTDLGEWRQHARLCKNLAEFPLDISKIDLELKDDQDDDPLICQQMWGDVNKSITRDGYIKLTNNKRIHRAHFKFSLVISEQPLNESGCLPPGAYPYLAREDDGKGDIARKSSALKDKQLQRSTSPAQFASVQDSEEDDASHNDYAPSRAEPLKLPPRPDLPPGRPAVVGSQGSTTTAMPFHNGPAPGPYAKEFFAHMEEQFREGNREPNKDNDFMVELSKEILENSTSDDEHIIDYYRERKPLIFKSSRKPRSHQDGMLR